MKILVCVADIPQTKTAVLQGGELVRLVNSQLTLLHVEDPGTDREVGEAILEKAESLAGVTAEKQIRQGEPADEILAEIDEGDHDLVILGANQKASLTERLLGSVALRITSQAPISVLVTKGEKYRLKKILITTRGVETANPAIETGGWLAHHAKAEATLLHMIPPAPSMYTGLKRVEESLPSLLKKDTPLSRHLRHGAEILNRYQVDAKLEIRYGTIVEGLINETIEGNYDLLIVGPTDTGAIGRLRKWLLGDMKKEIVERALCSILVIRNSLIPETK